MPRSRLGIVFALCLATILLGCGGEKGKGKLYSAEGTVTKDGKPLKEITVHFIPVTEGEAAASGQTDENGRFELVSSHGKGAVPGKYKVILSASIGREAYAKIRGGSGKPPAADGSKEIPKEYLKKETTPKEVEVTSDPEQNKFEIKL